MRINPVGNRIFQKQNFKGIIAPQTEKDLPERIFGNQAAAYEAITDKKGVDIILLEYVPVRAFIVDKTKQGGNGQTVTYKTLESSEPGDFNRRVKDALCLVKADENMSAAGDILRDEDAKEKYGAGLKPAIQRLTDREVLSKVAKWQEELEKI